MKTIDILCVPFGAGGSFIGYVQNLIKQKDPTKELSQWGFRKDGSSWDDYVCQFKTFEPLTQEEKQAKKLINSSRGTEQDYKHFAEVIQEGRELMFHFYPLELLPYVNLNNRLFVNCTRAEFEHCWHLGISKNKDKYLNIELEAEWQRHQETKIKCTFDYHINYKDLFVKPNKTVIQSLMNATTNEYDIDLVVEQFTRYGKQNKVYEYVTN